ncbi:MAG: glycosyltransferase family 9 protein [Rhodocyclaceae bacterium]|nr:glycosyltransferase family 9 protein [Rhodocyclaceae bacterium]
MREMKHDAPVFTAAPPRSILLVCTRRIGDVLLATPLIRSMKAQWPDTPIDMLVFRGTEGVLEHNPDIRRVITVKQRTGIFERAADIMRLWRRHELACAVNGSDRSLIYAWVAGRKRVGVVNADRVTALARWTLNKIALDRHLEMHTVSSVLALAPLIGVAPLGEVVAPGIGDDPARRKGFEARFDAPPAVRPEQPLVVLHPSPMFTYKQWSINGWAETIQWLYSRGYAIALSGGPATDERKYAEQVIATANVPVLNCVGDLSFGETAEMFRRAKLYIGPDTGATHVAAACGTPTIALFGPTDPVRWAPWPYQWPAGNEPWSRHGSALRGNVYLMQGEGSCVPCRGEGCDGHPGSDSQCLMQLPSQRVIAIAAQLLGLPASNAVVTLRS